MLFVFSDRAKVLSFLEQGGNVAEIGVFAGDFAREIQSRVIPDELHLVDPWKMVEIDWDNPPENLSRKQLEYYKLFLKRACPEYSGGHPDGALEIIHSRVCDFAGQHPGVHVHRGISKEIMPRFPDEHFDLVYIDADHRYASVMEDLLLAEKKVKPGGFIAGHDFFENGKDRLASYGVIDAVNTFCKRTGYFVFLLTAEPLATFFLAKEHSDYTRGFLQRVIGSHAPIMEIPSQLAPCYLHKIIDADGRSIPSFGGDLANPAF